MSNFAWHCYRHVNRVEAYRIETMTGKDGAWSYTIADDYTSSAHPLPNKRPTTVASARFTILFLLPSANSGPLALQIHAGFRKGLSQGCVFEVAGAEILHGTEGRCGAWLSSILLGRGIEQRLVRTARIPRRERPLEQGVGQLRLEAQPATRRRAWRDASIWRSSTS